MESSPVELCEAHRLVHMLGSACDWNEASTWKHEPNRFGWTESLSAYPAATKQRDSVNVDTKFECSKKTALSLKHEPQLLGTFERPCGEGPKPRCSTSHLAKKGRNTGNPSPTSRARAKSTSSRSGHSLAWESDESSEPLCYRVP